MNCDIKKIVPQFQFCGTMVECTPWGNGHINSTFAITCQDGQGSRRYIVQKINHHTFKDVEKLMGNIERVTSYLRKEILASGGDPDRETLTIIKTQDGKNYYQTPEGEYYRAYLFIENAEAFDVVGDPSVFYKTGAAFGRFQRLLKDYPANTLYETIPDFHNTAKRFETFLQAVQADCKGRAAGVQEEIQFVKDREQDAHKLVDMIDRGELPLRVTHNDTKLNNIMIDNRSKEGICVIDLDTVMPGLALYDFGDSIRFGANTAVEDEKDLSKVKIDLGLFEQYTKGFLSEVGQSMTPAEINQLAFASKLMTFECGMRFLTDYLEGDTYFKTAYADHNLVRCRDQFKLVKEMEIHMDEMEAIVKKCAE